MHIDERGTDYFSEPKNEVKEEQIYIDKYNTDHLCELKIEIKEEQIEH